jgi:lysozyme family protein
MLNMELPISNPAALMQHYQLLWDTMVIREDWERRVIDTVQVIKQNQHTYELFVQSFNPALPWYVVAAIHTMEASGSFECHLHNGDSLKQRTVHVPKGRPLLDPLNGIGKPYMWHESAKDALAMEEWHNYHLWDMPHILFRLENYNGCGYRNHGINSPYLWSATNHYSHGKFTEDGHFAMDAVSKQVGAAAIIKRLL